MIAPSAVNPRLSEMPLRTLRLNSPPGFTLRQKAYVDVANQLTVQIALTGVAAGDLLCVTALALSLNYATLTDSQGNSYTLRGQINNGAVSMQVWTGFANAVGAGGALTLTYEGDAGSGTATPQAMTVCDFAFTGGNTVFFDNAITGFDTTALIAPGSLAIVTPDLVYCGAYNNGLVASSGGGGLTLANSTASICDGYNLKATSSPQNPTITLPSSAIWASCAIGLILGNQATMTLGGPASGQASQPVTFTVTPSLATVDTITFSDGGAGGTFTPTSLTFSSSSGAAQSFTYTSSGSGVKSLSIHSANGNTLAGSPFSFHAVAMVLVPFMSKHGLFCIGATNLAGTAPATITGIGTKATVLVNGTAATTYPSSGYVWNDSEQNIPIVFLQITSPATVLATDTVTYTIPANSIMTAAGGNDAITVAAPVTNSIGSLEPVFGGLTPWIPTAARTMKLGACVELGQETNFYPMPVAANLRLRSYFYDGNNGFIVYDPADATLPYTFSPSVGVLALVANYEIDNAIESSTGQIGYPVKTGTYVIQWDDANANTPGELQCALRVDANVGVISSITGDGNADTGLPMKGGVRSNPSGNTIVITYANVQYKSMPNLAHGYNLNIQLSFNSTSGNWSKNNTITNMIIVGPGDTVAMVQANPYAITKDVKNALTASNGNGPAIVRSLNAISDAGVGNFQDYADCQQPSLFSWCGKTARSIPLTSIRGYSTDPTHPVFSWSSSKVYDNVLGKDGTDTLGSYIDLSLRGNSTNNGAYLQGGTWPGNVAFEIVSTNPHLLRSSDLILFPGLGDANVSVLPCTGGLNLTLAETAQVGVAGTFSITQYTNALTSSAGSGLAVGMTICLQGDASEQALTIASGSGTSWTTSATYNGLNQTNSLAWSRQVTFSASLDYPGTFGVTKGSNAITATSGAGLAVGNSIAFTAPDPYADTSSANGYQQVYTITSGSGGAWNISPAYGGPTYGTAAGSKIASGQGLMFGSDSTGQAYRVIGGSGASRQIYPAYHGANATASTVSLTAYANIIYSESPAYVTGPNTAAMTCGNNYGIQSGSGIQRLIGSAPIPLNYAVSPMQQGNTHPYGFTAAIAANWPGCKTFQPLMMRMSNACLQAIADEINANALPNSEHLFELYDECWSGAAGYSGNIIATVFGNLVGLLPPGSTVASYANGNPIYKTPSTGSVALATYEAYPCRMAQMWDVIQARFDSHGRGLKVGKAIGFQWSWDVWAGVAVTFCNNNNIAFDYGMVAPYLDSPLPANATWATACEAAGGGWPVTLMFDVMRHYVKYATTIWPLYSSNYGHLQNYTVSSIKPKLIGYEGQLQYVAPDGNSQLAALNHDAFYHPGIADVWNACIGSMQDGDPTVPGSGLQLVCLYGLCSAWGYSGKAMWSTMIYGGQGIGDGSGNLMTAAQDGGDGLCHDISNVSVEVPAMQAWFAVTNPPSGGGGGGPPPGGPGIVVSPSVVGPNHSTPVLLSIAGTGTSFSSSSTVVVTNSITGTTTVTKGTWTASSSTHATLAITTGAGYGTWRLTIDGIAGPILRIGHRRPKWFPGLTLARRFGA
jgi:hypothetical protein